MNLRWINRSPHRACYLCKPPAARCQPDRLRTFARKLLCFSKKTKQEPANRRLSPTATALLQDFTKNTMQLAHPSRSPRDSLATPAAKYRIDFSCDRDCYCNWLAAPAGENSSSPPPATSDPTSSPACRKHLQPPASNNPLLQACSHRLASVADRVLPASGNDFTLKPAARESLLAHKLASGTWNPSSVAC